jgi:glycosyltransferase involved in cell wall biosynthesis
MTSLSTSRINTSANDRRVPVTVIVATKNEEANIENCLLSLAPAERVLVVDSCSTDATQTIAGKLGAELVTYSYSGGYPKKRQWALDHLTIATPWTMLIDADEQVTPALWREIESNLSSSNDCTAYLILKEFHFLGKRLRFGGFSHAAIALFCTGLAKFEQLEGNEPNGQDMEVHERLIVEGKVGRLRNPLLHNDYKGLYAYIDRHNKYSTWEAGIRSHYLETGSWGNQAIHSTISLDVQSLRRFLKSFIIKLPCEPSMWFLYHYIFRGAILEGRRGYIAACIRRAYIEQVHSKIYELRLSRKSRTSGRKDSPA